ncbi:hypothetical protein CYMTET_22074 [Cymbomonas tetramitiformis]|uniref:Uncharacterized protein n=1 Tax=Cymbomonas tetramitiformis TaxID=36881 RepID=A0AAE0G194_9CHLO|nr:hypothetical protein CYMTET_22074 [Cymbomonas tetramitiformis]
MIGYRAMLEGDNEAYGGAEAVRAKLAFTDQKIYAGTEGMVADTVQTKWLSEFNNSKAKAVMTTTTKQAAGQIDDEINKSEEEHSGTTAEMQAAALEKTTADNYERHWKKFVKFCTEENLQWLPATATTVPLYMAALQKSGAVKGTSL